MNIVSFITKSVGRKIVSGYALALVLTVIIGVISFFSMRSLNQTAHWVDHTHLVLAQLDKITSGLKDAETGQRGFLITNLENYLEPYTTADDVVQEAVDELRQLTSDNPLQQQRIDKLEPLIAAKFDELEETIDLRRKEGFERALAVVLTDKGKAVMDEIRGIINAMTEEEEALLEVRAADSQATSLRVTITIILITVLSMLLLSAIGFLTVRSIVTPVRELADKAGRVAEGDLTATVDIIVADEIGTLARAFNSMVEKIKQSMEAVRIEKAGVEKKVEHAVRESEAQQVYLSQSVERILAEMERFADGDLTVQLEAERTDDEIGQLYQGFNRAVSNIGRLFDEVRQAVASTVTASAQISSATEELAAGSQEQSSQSNEVAAAVEEMARTIVENASNATQTAEVANKNGQVAKQGGAVVEQTVDKIRQIATVVGDSTQTVERLGASSKQVGEIVSVIDDIAEQTNLLALNAAIEAARAGEQGRGFAVVADEVRKLAERTTSATKEIAAMIKTIQSETAEAVRAMMKGNEEVRAGIELADQAGASLERIVAETENTVDLINQIASASEEQSTTSEQISRSVESISTVADESARGISEIARSSDELNHLMDTLSRLVAQFKTHDQAERGGRPPSTHTANFVGGDGWSQVV